MGYVTADFYKNTYHGNSIPDDKLQDMLDKASMDVDLITRRKIHKLGGFDELSEFEQLQVQLAVCFQADYSYNREFMSGVSSYSIGDVSVGVDGGEAYNRTYDKACMLYLNSTRLIYRGL